MAKSILFIAFHFPPCFGSSGLQRTLSFVRYFAKHPDWQPLVLSASSSAYPKRTSGQLKDIPASVPVTRAFALDTSRHLAVAGRYLDAMARPDRWVSWYLGGVIAGLRLIKKHRPVAIWSTYPISTAHMIGAKLSQMSGLPWIADFRDPMVEFDAVSCSWFPKNSSDREARLRVEEKCVRLASRLVFCTESALDIAVSRYSRAESSSCHVVANGYEEGVFSEIEASRNIGKGNNSGAVRLLHSGTIYPGPDRDPTGFFRALGDLKRDGVIDASRLQVTLRATGYDDIFGSQIVHFGIEDIVELAPAVDYREAIAEMLMVDALLLFQGRTSNPAIPAKLYEYLRCQKPILACVDPAGETARVLQECRVGLQASIDDTVSIRKHITTLMSAEERSVIRVLDRSEYSQHSREVKAAQLESIIHRAVLGS